MATAKSVREVTLILTENEASELKSILMNDVDWTDHPYGRTAGEVYNALDDADVSEA